MRPRRLDDVVGQEHVIPAVQRALARDDKPHLFLFCGPSGCGKTTIARIIAASLGCAQPLEIDAAAYSGVDDIRELRDYVAYQSLDKSPKLVILDECHSLSKAAWQASLKVMEEPPPHAYFILCTTDPGKVPETIKTRATVFTLKSVPAAVLMTHGEKIVNGEAIALPDGALRYIVSSAEGSVRQLLVGISLCEGAKDIPDVQRLLEQAGEDDQLLTLSRMLCSNRRSFDRARKSLAALRADYEPEAVRIGLIEYITAAFLSAETTQHGLVRLLDLLSQPVPARGGWAALCASLYAALQDERN